MGGERRNRHQVGAGAGIHQQAVAHPHKRRQLFLHCRPFAAEGEPEIQGGTHRSRHFLFREHPAGIGDRAATFPRFALRVLPRPEGGMGLQ